MSLGALEVDRKRGAPVDNLAMNDDISELTTEPAEDEQGYRHDDLEVGSKVVYEGEICTVASIGRSGIRLEERDIGVREGGMELIVGKAN